MPTTTAPVEAAASSLDRARLAARAARYQDALVLLDGCEDWPEHVRDEAIVLKADALGRKDAVAAVEWLTGVADAVATPRGRFAYAIAAGRAFTHVRDLETARGHYADAEALAHHDPDGALTLAYHRSRLAWISGDFNPNADDVAASVTHPDPDIAMAALATRGWHHGSVGDLRAQISDFRLALAMLDLETDLPLSVGTAAITCYSLVRAAFETADAEAMADVRARFEQIAWTDDVAVDRFQTLRIMGWDSFMRGNSGPAQWSFKAAMQYSPSVPWTVMARLDRAFVARIAGNEAWAVEEIAEAERLGRTVRWEETAGEERVALLTLATLLAPTNAARAQRYASTFSALGLEAIHPTLAIKNDPRTRAFARFAQGRIDAVLGRAAAAERTLREAYETFAQVGFVFRASMTARSLAELTGEASWREKAASHASAYPSSPLAELPAAAAAQPALPVGLSPFQQQVARGLAGGAELVELSRSLSRSLYTIERQVTAVYEAFGVGSRSEFLASARAIGLA